MNQLLLELQKEFEKLPDGINVPKEIEQLYGWIHQHGFIDVPSNSDCHYGRISEDYEYSPDISFTISGQNALKYWFGIDEVTEEISSRLIAFAESGMCGSLLAFWLDDNNQLKIVHMGSDAEKCCVVSNDAKAFLSLLSIGYNSLDRVYDFSLSPEELYDSSYASEDEDEAGHKINQQFIDWIESTFGIKRPHDAAHLIKETPSLGDEDTEDPFCLWCNKIFNEHH